ncbi:putative IQ motif, EF-hand binding protein [Helianthus annuus]|uniref:IQ motif, EF-hand binding protein n=1 Tax=Helianthus annuus TaxID=4232 RepID=A0A251SDF2_HELAN|nr:putative IQ motif, EF-hand binding protein [Helianthus annuus]KAJ0453303.1 putative IQ motif, EF-hand binding protein [Helianthus annuus]KAJ0475230.1 putative IQ motif, EF-hand binding protein [Helianthus annuus]KAJ0654535.1 putative IQ motif, EF-hand binding protein [Helianthus annuus]KAJ0847279.1 putative IQ motif, EF-hand binding protein [Helianthus annuus]
MEFSSIQVPPFTVPKIGILGAICCWWSSIVMNLQPTFFSFSGSLLFTSRISSNNWDYPFLLLPFQLRKNKTRIQSFRRCCRGSNGEEELVFCHEESCFYFQDQEREGRSNKSKSNPKNSLQVNQVSLDACSSHTEAALANPIPQYHSIMDTEFIVPENEQIKHVDVDTITYTTIVAEDVVSQSAATSEEISATKIQAAYRGYTARRAFRSLRAMRRLKLWLQGQAVKRQTTSALMRIQTMGRVQSQVRARSMRMAEVNETLQRQQIKKRQKVLEKQAFDLSPKSKAQVEASLRSKKEAAERREKALAYAFSRQQMWRNSQSPKSAVVDPKHFDWAWSWSNRWDAIRPRETGAMVRPQSPPSKPALSSGQRSTSPKSVIPKASPRRVNTGCRVGLANKRHLVTSTPFTGAARIAVR